MKLSDYLRSRRLSPYRFARDADVAHTTVSRLLAGEVIPQAKTRAKISRATGGKVSELELLLEGAAMAAAPADVAA